MLLEKLSQVQAKITGRWSKFSLMGNEQGKETTEEGEEEEEEVVQTRNALAAPCSYSARLARNVTKAMFALSFQRTLANCTS
jgi:hypothetical protein